MSEKEQNKNAKKMQQMFSYVTTESLRNLDGYTDLHLNDPKYIPETLSPVIKRYVVEKRKDYDYLRGELEKHDKASDMYMSINNEIEHIQRSFMNLRGDIDLFKKTKMDFKNVLGEMNKGTQDSNHFLNSAVFGELASPEIDKHGNLLFMMETPVGGGAPNNIAKYKMKDMSNVKAGQSPIITEPYGTKNFVWKMAEDTYNKKQMGAGYDPEWTKRMVSNNINSFGPSNIIGTAFTDLTGDNRAKSFAEQYEEGLNKKEYSTHPITGEKLPTDSSWMKDPANTEALSILLTNYITDVMTDIYGVIDSETGMVTKNVSQVDKAKQLIAKYGKKK